jgi:hypothetical protein
VSVPVSVIVPVAALNVPVMFAVFVNDRMS